MHGNPSSDLSAQGDALAPPPALLPQGLSATVGMIGGMGPDAGADLVFKFLRECRAWLNRHGLPITDQSYPPHLLVQHPIPDRSQAIAQSDIAVTEMIVNACRTAVNAGATTLGIACNTAHYWYPQIVSATQPAKVLHIADVAARAVAERGFQRAALMATPATCASGLYHDALCRYGIHVVDMSSSQLTLINEAIYKGVKSGNYEFAGSIVKRTVDELLLNADCVVLGCTELPIAINHVFAPNPERIVDATATLATALVEAAFGARQSVSV